MPMIFPILIPLVVKESRLRSKYIKNGSGEYPLGPRAQRFWIAFLADPVKFLIKNARQLIDTTEGVRVTDIGNGLYGMDYFSREGLKVGTMEYDAKYDQFYVCYDGDLYKDRGLGDWHAVPKDEYVAKYFANIILKHSRPRSLALAPKTYRPDGIDLKFKLVEYN